MSYNPILGRMFFGLAHELGFDAEEIKNKAKAKFNKDHFNDLTNEELNFLIDKLAKIKYEREKQGNHDVGNP